MYRSTEWAYLVRHRSDEARERLRIALKATHGDAQAAARALGISPRSCHRYITELGLRGELEAVREGEK